MSDSLGIALVGCGTVGTGVARLLLEQPHRWKQRTGQQLTLRRVIVRDLHKHRPVSPELLSTDWRLASRDPAAQILVELVGGTTLAREVVLDALAHGKHVVTANKALLAAHGPEVFEAAREAGRVVAFEASVAGGVPIIAAISQSLAANQIRSIQGILNGTCNFILTQMADQGQSYSDALAEAQARGYAEADPTLDVDGSDAAHKLAILARLAFGANVPPETVLRHGIAGLPAMDLRFADELGYTIKLLAEAWLDGDELALHVAPVLLRHASPLAQVRGAFNAIQVIGDVVGETLFQGPGAGMMPTASAVLADILDIAIGRAQRTFAATKLWLSSTPPRLRPPEGVRSRFYLRLLVRDQPGVLADVARLLAQGEISIASVIQHEAQEDEQGSFVPLVIMTHTAVTGNFHRALTEINRLKCVGGPGVYFTVSD